ncbi:hypothetical protein, partial [Pseudomonas sp. KCJK8993]|uniref:hypothetical protein n=1 Tax=Pseudomonas sp. KCJK8993 TaxID=3344565 RepID=UPI00390662BC
CRICRQALICIFYDSTQNTPFNTSIWKREKEFAHYIAHPPLVEHHCPSTFSFPYSGHSA